MELCAGNPENWQENLLEMTDVNNIKKPNWKSELAEQVNLRKEKNISKKYFM